jgi:hypothetical protein
MAPTIGIVVLNFNNVADTLHAVQSILSATDATNHVLIVVDNASTDNSWSVLTQSSIFNKHVLELNDEKKQHFEKIPAVHLLQTIANKGYAFGNNCGIKKILQDESVEYIWVLNNDVELAVNCIDEVQKALLQETSLKLGVWGTLLVNFDTKNHLQALAGKYHPLIGKTKLLLPNLPVKNLSVSIVKINSEKANYLIGASILFSRAFLAEVGLFNEQYFLYAEEIDIFLRAKKKKYEKSIISKAIVYHKEGSTTKSTNQLNNIRNTFIEFHNCRSKLIFTKNYYPAYYPIVYLLIMINLLWIYKRNLSKALFVWKCLRKDVYTT